MTITKAINLAKEAGWNPECVVFCPLEENNYDHLVADKDFFQCLGKAMGWKKYVCFITGVETDVESILCCCIVSQEGYFCGTEGWLYYWRQLIDHLADGGTIESYFAKL